MAMTDAVGSLEAFHDLPSVLEDEHQWCALCEDDPSATLALLMISALLLRDSNTVESSHKMNAHFWEML
jgi:hypothetical protein